VQWVRAANRVHGNPDVQTALIGIQCCLTDAGVQVHAGHDQRVNLMRLQTLEEVRANEGRKPGLVDYPLLLPRREFCRWLVTGRAGFALPISGKSPVRHAVVGVASHGGLDMRYRHAQPSAQREQLARLCDNVARGRLQPRDIEKITLEINQN
jgi:hypothetical protein